LVCKPFNFLNLILSPRKVQALTELNPEFFAEKFELNDDFQANPELQKNSD